MSQHFSSSQGRLCFGLLCCWAVSVSAQAPKGNVKPTDPPPALTYHSLIPGLTMGKEVREKLGKPAYENSWYAYKLLYPAKNRPGLTDSVHLEGGPMGKYACAESASVPDEFETKKQVLVKLGSPEYELRMSTFSLLDYSNKGVRFVFDREGKTIGVAYVPHLRPRVHTGGRKLVDISDLAKGPASPQGSSLTGLKAGASEVILSPKVEWIDPQYRKKFKPHDDLKGRCVVLEKAQTTVAIIGVDLFGLPLNEVEVVREALRKEGIDELIVGCSHNHAAPDMIGVYGFFPAEYNKFVREQLIEAGKSAKKALRAVGQIKVAARELPMDGARVIGYFRNARNPGIVDPSIALVQILGEDAKPIANITQFACHVEGIDPGLEEMSADFPGYMCERLKTTLGGQPVFLNGALGGMVSGDNKTRNHEEAKVMGEGLADILTDLAKSAVLIGAEPFSATTSRLEIPVTNLLFKPALQKRGRLYRGRVVTEMTLVRIGSATLLTVPGEVFPEVSFEILEGMKSSYPRMIVGLGNDQLGYIVPPYDFRDDYYEETMSVGPAAAPAVVDTALRMLKHQE